MARVGALCEARSQSCPSKETERKCKVEEIDQRDPTVEADFYSEPEQTPQHQNSDGEESGIWEGIDEEQRNAPGE